MVVTNTWQSYIRWPTKGPSCTEIFQYPQHEPGEPLIFVFFLCTLDVGALFSCPLLGIHVHCHLITLAAFSNAENVLCLPLSRFT